MITSNLKQILQRNDCSFGKYLAKYKYISSLDESMKSYYLTPLMTSSGRTVLIVTCIVNENWSEIVKELTGIIEHIKISYKYDHKRASYILHAYFDRIEIEHYYSINMPAAEKLISLSLGELDSLLA